MKTEKSGVLSFRTLFGIIFLCFLVGCNISTQQVIKSYTSNESIVNLTVIPKDIEPPLHSGIYGVIKVRTGGCELHICDRNEDCKSSCYEGPPKDKIYVYNSTVYNNESLLLNIVWNHSVEGRIAETVPNSNGFFNVSVPPGEYVLFFQNYQFLTPPQNEDFIIVNNSYVEYNRDFNFATD